MSKYSVLQAQRNGQPVIIVVDNELDDRDGPSFPSLLTVRLPMRSFDPTTGLCDQPESARLDGIEDSLLSALEASEYRLVGHVTGNGAREIVIYVRDPESVKNKLKRALSNVGETSASVDTGRDPNWDYYHQFPLSR
jgi:hypothetical protein